MFRRAGFFLVVFFVVACTFSQEPAPYTSYGGKKGAGSAGIHTVLYGDTLYSIARHYRLPMRDIIYLNRLSPPYRLAVGYRLKLPPPNEYRVREGDTLFSIGRAFDVSVNRIARLNNIRPPYTISRGQVLRLPSPYEKNREVVGGGGAVGDKGRASVSGDSKKEQKLASVRPVPGHKPSPVSRTGGGKKSAASARSGKKPASAAHRKTASASRTRGKSTVGRTPPRSGDMRFMRPVSGKIISSYGAKAGGAYNDGINIKARRGTPVRAVENGVVVYTGNSVEGYGNLVLVRHADRWMSAYAHLDKFLVKRGTKLKRGQALGTVGSTGQVKTPQLHFELRRGTKPLDPQKYL